MALGLTWVAYGVDLAIFHALKSQTLKNIYVKSNDWLANWIPENLTFDVQTAFGAQIRVNKTDLLNRRIYYFGVWEPVLTSHLSRILQKGDIFIDIGANIGYFSLLASSLVGPDGEVIAIEPSPLIAMKMLDNLRLNNCTNVKVIQVAASDRRGSLRILPGPRLNVGSTRTSYCESSEGKIVACLPLCDILEGVHVDRIKAIKIDVEGAEMQVIAGLIPMLNKFRTDVQIMTEVRPHQLVANGTSFSKFIAPLLLHGFQPYYMDNRYEPEFYLNMQETNMITPLKEFPEGILGFDDPEWAREEIFFDLLFSRTPVC